MIIFSKKNIVNVLTKSLANWCTISYNQDYLLLWTLGIINTNEAMFEFSKHFLLANFTKASFYQTFLLHTIWCGWDSVMDYCGVHQKIRPISTICYALNWAVNKQFDNVLCYNSAHNSIFPLDIPMSPIFPYTAKS